MITLQSSFRYHIIPNLTVSFNENETYVFIG